MSQNQERYRYIDVREGAAVGSYLVYLQLLTGSEPFQQVDLEEKNRAEKMSQ
ncbi:MAG: hypothetical protein F6K63_15640 [Moorea sp. SIO1G6]|uniref:hypothetical protein n=1 Tax=Moorena sp. SIO1G6 TaxID=2607840 RepID=UPI0013BF09BC|nr:hypothetical protein [Moorena sp. SIO1G6]NET65741.1 hypothetical protein [Moorena sp. SIO1G6]